MTKHKLKSEEIKSKSQLTDKKRYVLGGIVAIIIAVSPYYFYLYESVPDQQVWDTYFFTYDSKYYDSAYVAMWTITGKVIPFIFLVIWFFTCRHWWYHALLIPISMYVFQISNVLNEDLQYIDEFQLKYLVPIMAIIIPSIYLVRARIFNKINSVNQTIQDIEDELMYKPKNIWELFRQYF